MFKVKNYLKVKLKRLRKPSLVEFFLILSLIANAIFIFELASFKSEKIFEAMENKYPLISNRVLRDIPQDILLNFLPLRKTVIAKTDTYGDDFAMYFEYLPTGVSIAVNSTDDFQAASLFKIPISMAYFRTLEDRGEYSNPTLTITPDKIDKGFGDLWKKGVGYQISAEEAIKLAIQKSDNTAIKLIIPLVNQDSFDEVYNGLDISNKLFDEGPILNARQYSSIIKALYFSSVLTFSDSEKILDIMTHSAFNDKLPAGVGDNVIIAHKIGVFEDKLYSDCGIVYVPRRPYLLCMISKSDENTARKRMKDVSKTIYDYVSQVEPPKASGE